MKHIEKAWEGYSKILPSTASDIQVRETKQAFFAGAAILFTAIMHMLEPGEEPTDNDMDMMTQISAEIDEFGHNLDKKVFGSQQR